VEVKEIQQVIKWVGWYLHNVSPNEIFDNVYGLDHTADYKAEKVQKIMNKGLDFYFEIDSELQQRLIEFAIKKYSKE
jgi:hypothetical protein